MNKTPTWQDIAVITLEGSEAGTLTFPESWRMLTEAGFDGYAVDFRRNTRTYYRPDGQTLELETAPTSPVAERFDAGIIKDALAEAKAQVPGYTYKGFCAKVAGAGCAGYLVSFLGKRVLYYGRTGETHTEFSPGMPPTVKR
jgi:uncharacterized protein YbcV (DUF1398 family)